MSLDVDQMVREAARPTRMMLEAISEESSPVAEAVIRHVTENFLEPKFKLSQLKEKLKVNDRNLSAVGREIGITIGKLSAECCMETAFRLLRDTLLLVEEIAYLVGYDSLRAFRRRFILWCGLTPDAMRKRARPAREELRSLSEEVFSWYFRVRFERGEVAAAELGRLTGHLGKAEGL